MFTKVFKKEGLFWEIFFYQELSFVDVKTYLFSALFVAGNVALPYILHQFYLGGHPTGKVFLPIYFFVLIGAYKFGWRVGVITALFSPIASFALTQMPTPPILFFVVAKGLFLALVAGFLVKKYKILSLYHLFLVIVLYQLFGVGAIYLFTRDINFAMMDLRIGYPGLLVQLFGGYLILKLLNKVNKYLWSENL